MIIGLGDDDDVDTTTYGAAFSRAESARAGALPPREEPRRAAVDPQTENLDSQGLDSVRFLISRGGMPRSIGNLPEI